MAADETTRLIDAADDWLLSLPEDEDPAGDGMAARWAALADELAQLNAPYHAAVLDEERVRTDRLAEQAARARAEDAAERAAAGGGDDDAAVDRDTRKLRFVLGAGARRWGRRE